MKRRLKKKPIIILVTLLVIFITAIIITLNYINYINSDKYKLLEAGYTEEDIVLINKKIKNIDDFLNIKYDKKTIKFIDKKYFNESNLTKYLKYYNENDYNEEEVIAIINTGNDKQIYEESKKTDINKNELMLVNKYNYLEKDYEPKGGLTKISSMYAYGDNEVATEIYDILKDMFKAANKDGIKLIVNSAYRDYETQVATYNYYEHNFGKQYAIDYVAKPGFSEHQTGYVLDIFTPGETSRTFYLSDGSKWLENNAYKYGFILRYPEGKEYLTGYNYESWHYRYVGIEAAKIIKEENLTYEEYYTYYIK